MPVGSHWTRDWPLPRPEPFAALFRPSAKLFFFLFPRLASAAHGGHGSRTKSAACGLGLLRRAAADPGRAGTLTILQI